MLLPTRMRTRNMYGTRPSSPEDPSASSSSRVIPKVPILTFRHHSSHSPGHRKSVSASPMTPSGLTPGLVCRDPSTSPEIPNKLPTFCSTSSIRPSLPIYHRRKDDVTILPRECRQTRGEVQVRIISAHCVKGRSKSTEAAATAEVVKDYSTTATVDEIDKWCKSFDLPLANALNKHSSTSPASPEPFSTAFGLEPHGRDIPISSTASSSSSDNEFQALSDIFNSSGSESAACASPNQYLGTRNTRIDDYRCVALLVQ